MKSAPKSKVERPSEKVVALHAADTTTVSSAAGSLPSDPSLERDGLRRSESGFEKISEPRPSQHWGINE